MIEVRDLSVRYGRTPVVQGLSFDLAGGESLALWGGNGAGKTTVIRALLGQLRCRGELRVGGFDARRQGRQARALLGYVPQQLAFYDDMSALGLLRWTGRLRRAPREQPERLLARVGLGDHGSKAVGALSGGMKQRLALALALLGDPPLLILDEPTANLDVAARADFTALLAEQRAAGRSLLLTSHRLAEVRALADRVLVLEDGVQRRTCTPEELAAALDEEAVLLVSMPASTVEAALAALAARGYEARRNGRGVRVRVDPSANAAPLHALAEAGIAFDNLRLEGEG